MHLNKHSKCASGWGSAAAGGYGASGICISTAAPEPRIRRKESALPVGVGWGNWQGPGQRVSGAARQQQSAMRRAQSAAHCALTGTAHAPSRGCSGDANRHTIPPPRPQLDGVGKCALLQLGVSTPSAAVTVYHGLPGFVDGQLACARHSD